MSPRNRTDTGRKTLSDILRGVACTVIPAGVAPSVRALTCDSRFVTQDSLFVAVKGYAVDGHTFIDTAIAAGASVVVAERDFNAPAGVTKVVVHDMRRALPVIAANFYGDPSAKLVMTGITGTNGKTTITYLIERILALAGRHPGVIGTINYRYRETVREAKNTTPGPLELQAILSEMVRHDVDACIMEVSSHALDQHRVDRIAFDAAIFTNITSDHLDYHRTVDDYFAAKVKIFGLLKKGGAAILNGDDSRVAALKKNLVCRSLTYALGGDADVRAEKAMLSLDGSSFTAVTPSGRYEITTRLIGRHNISNILAAIAAATVYGVTPEVIQTGIRTFGIVPGRLEPVELGQPFKVFVDFAHTEDALYNVLGLLREVSTRQIITVFGCGGARDRTKRPLMGKVACRFSDKVIITSDNPRSERPSAIIGEIERGIAGAFGNYRIVEDRERAIETALKLASPGDIVVIAGKGHEKYQIVGDAVIPFDDCAVARRVLAKRL